MASTHTPGRNVFGHETIYLLLILGAAAALYLHKLTFSDIWCDEVFSKAIARHSLPELLQLVADDFHPPLYFVGLKFFTAAVGNTDLTIRLFSALGGLGTLVLGYAVGRRVFGGRGALVLCLLLLALPMLGLYAHVARMYTWTAGVTTGVFLYAVLYARDARRSDLVMLGLFSLLAAYLHYYCLMAAFWTDLALLILLVARKHPAWRSVAAMGAVVFVLYLPWLIVLHAQAQAVHRNYWIPAVSWPTVWACYAQPFGGFYWLYPQSYVMLAVIAALTIAAVMRWASFRQRGDHVALGLSLLVGNATILTAAVVSLLLKPVLYPRYIMTIAPLVLIPPVLLLTSWNRSWLKAAVLGGLLGCGGFLVFTESGFSWGPYRQALRHLSTAHPEVQKLLHVAETTAAPFDEYGRGGPWHQAYLNNDRSGWYANMQALDGMVPCRRLGDWVGRDETFCLVEFVNLPVNRENIDLLLAQCRTLAVDEIADEKGYPGIKLKLHILQYGG